MICFQYSLLFFVIVCADGSDEDDKYQKPSVKIFLLTRKSCDFQLLTYATTQLPVVSLGEESFVWQ